MCGFIAQLIEHRTGIAEVTGSNPVEALFFFFRLLLSSCLNWKIHCEDHSSLSSITAVQIYELFHIYSQLSDSFVSAADFEFLAAEGEILNFRRFKAMNVDL